MRTAETPVRRSSIDPAAAEVLGRAHVEGTLVRLPDEQLGRKLYQAVDKVLTSLGGEWNRQTRAHVFPDEARIAERLFAVLDDGVLERELHGFFETPRALAQELIELADIRAEHRVLEPSAGRGAISDLLAEIVPAEQLYQVELQAGNHATLAAKGYRAPQLVLGDFLLVDQLPLFDRVAMNPPFERQRDVRHVLRAYEMLAPGGRLAAIMSAGTLFNKDHLTVALLRLVDVSSAGAIHENDRLAFKASGSSARTVTVVLDKPPAAKVDAIAATAASRPSPPTGASW